MLVDVAFPIFAPSKEWNQAFEKLDYDIHKVMELHGSPFISNQENDFKVADGIYYTDLNPEMGFQEAGLQLVSRYSSGYEEARKSWDYRNENGLKFISLFEIADMYKLALYGHSAHVEYGVCDSPEQILKQWPHLESSKQRHFITMTPIHKKHEPESGGWRWHKWGEYIGEHDIQCEYLYDEKDIELVFVFHIYTLKAESATGAMTIEMLLERSK